MSLRVTHISINANNPRMVAEFWCAALHWDITNHDNGFITISDPDNGPGLRDIDIAPVPDPKVGVNRLHMELRAERGSDQSADVARLESLGARRADVGQGPDVSWVVMADPEGNEFCVLSHSTDIVARG